MSRVILVGALVLFLCGFLVSGAPTNKEANSDLHIEKDNHHHEFDLGHRFNVKRINSQNTPRGGWQNNLEIEIIKAILYASVRLSSLQRFRSHLALALVLEHLAVHLVVQLAQVNHLPVLAVLLVYNHQIK
ncbi:hypothetical protein RP20_CCG026684 [Aedes albopictus]|nr:hypothetical protein RP20_CCG026684 [Aedes albopictus]